MRLSSIASRAISDVVDVSEVFSAFVYEGNNTPRDIVNGINLLDDGGMTWIKGRDDTYSNILVDTERGATYYLKSDATDASTNAINNTVTAFNSDGFSIGNQTYVNDIPHNYISWTFKEHPRFFAQVK